MTNADNMFYSLGWYKKEIPEEEMIEYIKESKAFEENEKIEFFKMDKQVSFDLAILNIKELKAIVKKCEELGR